ncbi:MAG: tyrosine-type recombinase/integrase [Flavobacteriaceae bacterium]|nr:MAG: tyrosine-type recombinase/integrase [Flavobacteriaceae bacterium]
MKTNLTLTLDTRRKKKNATFPIILRLSHKRKTTSISLGYSILESDWDKRNHQVKKSYKGVSSIHRLNNFLLKQKTDAMDIINILADKGELDFLSINQLKAKLTNQASYESFFDFGYSLVEEMKQSQRFGNARSYYGVLGTLKKYNHNRDLRFDELNYDYLKKFEIHYLSKEGNSLNGLAAYMRTIRAVYNKGIKAGLIEKEAYPFADYKIRMTPTEKRAIALEHVKSIVGLQLKLDHELFHVRNYFLASYLLYGISFIDMAFLKLENIVDGRIKFQRRKTSKVYDIKITTQLNEILKFYTEDKQVEDFIFPIIKRESLEMQYRDIDWARKRYNKGLKKLALLCGIDQRLTSYVSRHSFATQAMFQNVPLEAISAMLGHSRLTTTQIYLKSLPSNVLDDYNEQLSIL